MISKAGLQRSVKIFLRVAKTVEWIAALLSHGIRSLPGEKALKIVTPIIALVAVASPVVALASSTGVISEVVTNPNNGQVNFVVSGTRTSLPACANGQGLRWAVDGSQPLAQSTIAQILSAYAQKKTVYVEGTGACSSAGQPNIESVSFFVSKD